ncbi:MAG: hypothetical protein Ct9H300mP19_13010 [Dehalococcoidia bacterium]|nr:MAG: hypothetical protein Ct9H300mP19_13010 [Dehalococcoidia bacterium]
MEADIDDVPWKDEITGGPLITPVVSCRFPPSPVGGGLDEDVARAHVWESGRGPGF